MIGKIFQKHKKIWDKLKTKIKGLHDLSTQEAAIQILKTIYFVFLELIEIIGDGLFFFKNYGKHVCPKKILIIKIDQLGDVLNSTFLPRAIKKQIVGSEVHYVINQKSLPVVEKNTNINKVFFWESVSLKYLLGRDKNSLKQLITAIKTNFETLRKLRNEKYDAVINTRAFSPSTNIFWKMIGAKKIIAFDISKESFLADCWVAYDLDEEERINLERLLYPFQNIDKRNIEFETVFCNIDDLVIKKYGLNKHKKIIAIAPISFAQDRNWEERNWKALIDYLVSQGYACILTGLPQQIHYLEKIFFKETRNVFVLENLSISELGGLFKAAKFVITIDSFGAHLAIALQKKLFCFVNTRTYFLKGFSRRQTRPYAFSMIPIIKNVTIFDTQTSVVDVIKKIKDETLTTH